MFNFYTFGGSAGRFLSIRPTPRNMLKTIINPNVIPAPCTMLASIHAPKDGCCDCCCCCCCSGIGAGGGRANASGGACCVRSFFRIAFEVTSASLSGACGSLEKARAKRTPCPEIGGCRRDGDESNALVRRVWAVNRVKTCWWAQTIWCPHTSFFKLTVDG